MEILKIILAGGKSTRMGREKPILGVNGVPLVMRAYRACSNAVVAVSRHTPETKKFCISNRIPFINTPGRGYVEDVIWLLEEYGPFLSVSCDIPFIREGDIMEIENHFKKLSKRISLTGYLDLKDVPKGANTKIFGNRCIVGLNTVSHDREDFIRLSNPLLAFNINTPFDLFLANRLAIILDSEKVSDL
jgi:adenosylcobinamide-phosphate guanylyltransferase